MQTAKRIESTFLILLHSLALDWEFFGVIAKISHKILTISHEGNFFAVIAKISHKILTISHGGKFSDQITISARSQGPLFWPSELSQCAQLEGDQKHTPSLSITLTKA